MEKVNKKKSVNKKLTPQLKLKLRNEFVQGYDGVDEREFPNLDALIKKYKVGKSKHHESLITVVSI